MLATSPRTEASFPITALALSRASAWPAGNCSCRSRTTGFISNHVEWLICTALTPYMTRNGRLNDANTRCRLRTILYMSAERHPQRSERERATAQRQPCPSGSRRGRQPEIHTREAECEQAPHRELVVECPRTDQRWSLGVPRCNGVH